MGHEIKYFVCSPTQSRASIMDEIQNYARRYGDGYASYVTWHDNVAPLDSYDDAKNFIEQRDNGNYSDHAVRYYDYSGIPETNKIKNIREQITDLSKARAEWIKSHSVKSQKAQYIGCHKCGSKLSKEHLRGESCPLCGTDLRSGYILEKIEWYNNKIRLCYDAIEAEKKKQKNKAKIMWLVKFEFHN